MREIMKKLAVGYARTSSKSNPDESIPFQIRQIKEYSEKNGYILVDVYVDDEISGETNEERYDFQEMVKEVNKGKIDTVLVTFFSRFSRETFNYIQAIDYFRKQNVEVISILENSSTTQMNPLEIGVAGIAVELENEKLKKNVKEGRSDKLKKGIFPFGHPPYGYQKTDSGYLEINNEEVSIVHYIYDQYLNGISINDIKGLLKKEKIKIRGTVERVLTNRTYTGYIYYQPTKVVNGERQKENEQIQGSLVAHQKIIDEVTFDKVQEIYRKEDKNTKIHPFYLLKNLFYCPFCHNKMYINGTLGTYYCKLGECSSFKIEDIDEKVLMHLKSKSNSQAADEKEKQEKAIMAEQDLLNHQVVHLQISFEQYVEQWKHLDKKMESFYSANLNREKNLTSYQSLIENNELKKLREMLLKKKIKITLGDGMVPYIMERDYG